MMQVDRWGQLTTLRSTAVLAMQNVAGLKQTTADVYLLQQRSVDQFKVLVTSCSTVVPPACVQLLVRQVTECEPQCGIL